LRVLSLSVDRVTGTGLSLIVFGLIFGGYSYFVVLDSTYTAFGLACVVLGSVMVMVPSNPVPLSVVRAMIEGSAVNIEAVLEEYQARSKAYYLPPRDGRVYCYVPFGAEFSDRGLLAVLKAPVRVFTNNGGVPGVMVFPPGSEIVRVAALGEEAGVENALVYVLVDYLEAVDSVKTVEEGDNLVVQISSPRMSTDFPLFRECLGSVTVSVVGCVAAWVKGKPLAFLGEDSVDGYVTARFRVVDIGEE